MDTIQSNTPAETGDTNLYTELFRAVSQWFDQTVKNYIAASKRNRRRQTINDLRQLAATQSEDVIDGMIPHSSVNLIVGDSGIGKSPLMHQMAYAVGAGVPFVGYKTRRNSVLIVDFENSIKKRLELNERICRCLGIKDPGNVEYFSCDSPSELFREVVNTKPGLCIIDTLRLFDPTAEMRSVDAASLIRDLRIAADNSGTAFLIIHHPRKPSDQIKEEERPKLAETPVLEWLQQAAGSRALVNQTDVRIGVDGGREDAPLILRGFAKIDGEFGPITLERVIDDNEVPIGYARVLGTELLKAFGHRHAFDVLPPEFRFTDAQRALGTTSKSSTRLFLGRCMDAGLITKVGPIYKKLDRSRGST